METGQILTRMWNRVMVKNENIFQTDRDKVFLAMKIALRYSNVAYRYGLLSMEEFFESGCEVGKGNVPVEEYLGEITKILVDIGYLAELDGTDVLKSMEVLFLLRGYEGCEAVQACIYLMGAAHVVGHTPEDEAIEYFRSLVPPEAQGEFASYLGPALKKWKEEQETLSFLWPRFSEN